MQVGGFERLLLAWGQECSLVMCPVVLGFCWKWFWGSGSVVQQGLQRGGWACVWQGQ